MFDKFNLTSNFSHTGFIKNTIIYMGTNNNAVLVDCTFDSREFNIELFRQLSIHLPNELEGSVSKRLSEFLAGRYACKQAFLQLGFYPPPIINIGKNREPLWPTGYQGSITHSDNKALCIIGDKNSVCHIGIDIEEILTESRSEEISRYILLKYRIRASNVKEN